MLIGSQPRGPYDATLATRTVRCTTTPPHEEDVIPRDRLLRRRTFDYNTKVMMESLARNGLEVPFDVPLARDMDVTDVV
eukprot:5107494-Pyramimonas_sp.AAC.1